MRPIFPLPSSKIRCIVVFSRADTGRARAHRPRHLPQMDTTGSPEKVGARPTEPASEPAPNGLPAPTQAGPVLSARPGRARARAAAGVAAPAGVAARVAWR